MPSIVYCCPVKKIKDGATILQSWVLFLLTFFVLLLEFINLFFFSGGAELLFDKVKRHEVELQGNDCKDLYYQMVVVVTRHLKVIRKSLLIFNFSEPEISKSLKMKEFTSFDISLFTFYREYWKAYILD